MTADTNIRVLYLEDDPDALELVTFMLNLSGIQVITVTSFDEAARLAKNESFDLYLLDGLLPHGHSLDLCRELKQFHPETPVVFYSALGFPSDVRNGLAAGAAAYLVKPYSGDLAETIIKTIGKEKVRAAAVNDSEVRQGG